jgi:hypothetical protein
MKKVITPRENRLRKENAQRMKSTVASWYSSYSEKSLFIRTGSINGQTVQVTTIDYPLND